MWNALYNSRLCQLYLNPTKSEIICFDCSCRLLQCTKLSLFASSKPTLSIVHFVAEFRLTRLTDMQLERDLGVVLDSTLFLKPAISRACLFHLRIVRQLHSTIDSASFKH